MSERRDWSQLTPDEKEAAKDYARALMAKGETRWGTIARLCGLRGGVALRKALDPVWHEQQKAAERKAVRVRADLDGAHDAPKRIDPDCLAARLAEIPPDTRSLTGMLFGDPLPGRSALDKRRMT